MKANPLEDMLCFSLYSAARAVSQAYRAVLSERDLTYPQFLVLVSLHQSGSSSVGELGEMMHLDSGTLSPLLQRLEARDILTRTRREGDERVVDVALTETGLLLRRDVIDAVDCLSAAYGVEPAQFHSFLSTLHRITANMNDLTESRKARA